MEQNKPSYITDRADFSGTKRTITPEGYMKVPATLARCGVYDYSAQACKTMVGAEDIRASLGLSKSEPLRVYRDPSEVFDSLSLESFAMKPVTNNHPSEWLGSKNAKYYTVGYCGESIGRDGIYQTANLLITDASTIEDINNGKVEISNGYMCDITKSVGITDSGEPYHAKFTNIRGNHIAIVKKGRAGNGCRISDSNQNEDKEMSMKTIVLDGIEHEVSENAVQIIGKLQGDMAKVQDSLATAKAESDTKLAEMQAKVDVAEQGKVDAEAKVIDSAELDKMIEVRTALVADAKTLVEDFDASGKTEGQIREEVVCAVCDGIDMEGKDDSYKAVYFKARFDAALCAKANESDGAENAKVTDAKKCDEDEDKGEDARQKFIKRTEKKEAE